MTLHIHNTLTRTKEEFISLDPDHVRMYVCGPTVYDFAHIGNARPVVVFDVFYRLLKELFPKVTYVRNITDVDDKINAASKESGEDIRTITERTADMFHQDMGALNALDPDVEPRATEHITQMITMTEKLIEKGFAYEADGHVLFNVPSMEDYGQLSKRDRDEQIAGSRVEVATYKKDPADFVLWKPSEPNIPGWDSPWGRGRPGWHLECSAMSKQYLGESFDIHGGGQDLIFPHHENEIAQSQCANGTQFVKYWMHNGYLMVEGEKMSKSLGNFYTVHDLLKEFPGEAIRLMLLQTHYRKPLDFTKNGVAKAKQTLDRFYTALKGFSDIETETNQLPFENKAVIETLQDDLNTPGALSELHLLVKEINHTQDPNLKPALQRSLKHQAAILGILQQDPETWFKWQAEGSSDVTEAEIEALIEERLDARKSKNFARADQIRDDLAANGIVLEDGPQGTTWKRG
ncbi:MAG: cysteine--tRNA ligase [Alphaproteobacteria bacterium]|nr:cysteine--tRNA ligase [Rhodospirillales bacterium]MCW9045506.1 cysteine--tRNA ligase [Alphaproteobacteria bacterium]